MSNTRSLKAVSLLWFGSMLGAGCAFFTQVILARVLGPTELGVFASILGVVMLLTSIASFGLSGFWLKIFGQEGWQALRWLSSSVFYAGITTALALFALLLWGVFGPHDGTEEKLFYILSFCLIGQVGLELVSARLQLEERYKYLAIWQLIPHLTRIILLFGLMLCVEQAVTVESVAYLYAVVSTFVFIIGVYSIWGMCRGRLNLQGHGSYKVVDMPAVNWVRVASQSWPFGLASIFHLIYFQSDIVLLKYISGDAAAGIYNVAFTIMVAVYIFPSVVYQKFLIPKIHRWANHDRARFYEVYRKGNQVMLIFGVIAMIIIWILAPYFVPLLFGEAYIASVAALYILAIAAPIRFLATSVGATLVTQEHMKRKVRYMGVTALINIGMNMLAIPVYGVVGAAVTTVLSELILLALYFFGVRSVFKENKSLVV